jgi:tetratricopeptide (TPR) repeat protein
MGSLWKSTLFLILAVSWPACAPAGEKWLTVQTPHFTILTSASAEVLKQWAMELEQFEAALQRILPVPEERLVPVTVVLFPNDAELRPFKPLENGEPQDIAGFFVRIQDSQAIAVALDYQPEQTRRLIHHEATHWHNGVSDQPLPLWLDEGLAEVYSTFKVTADGRCSFGDLLQHHLLILAQTKMPSLEQLTTVSHGSLEYNEGDRASYFYAESWAFVHYLLFGKDTPGMKSIVRYLQAAEKATSPAEAFRQAFGTDYAGCEERLTAYIHGGSFHNYLYPLPKLDAVAHLAPRPASEGEVELALGTVLFGSRREATPEVMTHLQRAAALMPGNAEVWEVLGETAVQTGSFSEAADYFARASAAGSNSYYVSYGRGVTRLHTQSSMGDFSAPAEMAGAAEDFRRSIRLNPRFIPAYESLAGVLSAVERPEAADRARMERAKILAPDSAMIDVGLAVCDSKAGNREAARQRLKLVTASDRAQPAARSLAEELLKDYDWQEFNEHLDTLFRSEHYNEAVTAIDQRSRDFDLPQYQKIMAIDRRRAVGARQIAEAIAKANAGQVAEARALLVPLTSGDAEDGTRREAERLLREIDKTGG